MAVLILIKRLNLKAAIPSAAAAGIVSGPEDIIPTHMVLSAAFCRLIPVQHYLWEKQPAFTISGTEQLSETARFPEP